MIAADRAELESRLKQLTLQIREKEVTVFTDNFAVLSTQAAFLCGLSFSGLTMVPSWQRTNDKDPNKAYLLVFYTLTSISIGLNILVMAISSWCMIFGPSLAIRGPSGSMSRAVTGMYQERKWALRFFWLGILFIVLSSVALGWLKFDWYIALSMTLVFVSFLFIMIFYMSIVTRPRFRFPKDHSRKPQAFYVDGYDPESGTVAPTTNSSCPPPQKNKLSPPSTIATAELTTRRSSITKNSEAKQHQDPSAVKVREINWLLEQGLITLEQAAKQKKQALAMEENPPENADSSTNEIRPSSFFRRSSRGRTSTTIPS